MADIHMNPSVYKDPSKWDPSRYDEDRAEDKKVPLAYLGWGGGRHPCLGMRVSSDRIFSLLLKYARADC